MPVDQDRQNTARARTARIIGSLNEHLGNAESATLRSFREHLAGARTVIAGSDIDGLVSAMMAASVADWKIGALVVRSQTILVAPELGDIAAIIGRGAVIGLDVFSPLFPSVSNHPLLFGTTDRMRRQWLGQELAAFDAFIVDRCRALNSINLSTWVGIEARLGPDKPNGLPYKYPLGTAQVLLAALELAGRAPRFYDRQYLPWLVANCDGGVDTIRQYPWNVEGWWSALAAVVGPASQSEALYRLVTDQRPTQFIDVDRRLRYDEPERSKALNSRWNLASRSVADISTAVGLIADLSGWPDPFLGGVGNLSAWKMLVPTSNALDLRAITKRDPRNITAHLQCAREAVHVNFSNFRDRGVALGWMVANSRPDIEDLIGNEKPEELVAEEAAAYPAEELLDQA